MRQLYLAFIFTALLAADPIGTVKANPYLGGDLTYKCVGVDSFLIRLALYRDCTADTFPVTQIVTLVSPGCSTVNLILNLPNPPHLVTPLCPSWGDPCLGGGPSPLPFGIEQYFYEGLFVVHSTVACENWYMSWSSCCRSSNITTLTLPSTQGMYLGGTLHRGTAGGNGNPGAPCQRNSSPQFANTPAPFICVGQEFMYNHGVIDPDGDSLSFSLVPCRTLEHTEVSYAVPYSFTRPLSTSTPVSIDARTGTLRSTPDKEQVGVVCVRVAEYRNGVKIGEVMRELVFIAIDCSTSIPVASGISQNPNNWGHSFDTAICPGQYVSFNIYSTIPDSNFAKPVCMFWNEGISGADFSITHGTNQTGCFSIYPTGTFTWQTSAADEGYHFFTVTLMDDGCPLVAQGTWSYAIEVRAPAISLPDTLAICKGQPAVLDEGNASATVGFNQYSWGPLLGVANPAVFHTSFNPQVATTYSVMASNGFCSAYATMEVIIHEIDTTVFATHITLTAQEPIAMYQWVDCNLGYAPIPGATARDFKPDTTGSYAVVVSKYGCIDTSACHYVLLTSIEDAGHGPGIRLYPNPAKGTLYVEIEAAREGNYRLQLHNVAGQMVHGETIAVAEGNTTIQLETAHLAAGLYHVVVEGEDGRSVKKVVVME